MRGAIHKELAVVEPKGAGAQAFEQRADVGDAEDGLALVADLEDFIDALKQGRKPMIPSHEGRITTELFTAIYRSQRDGKPVKFPLQPEYERTDFDGRI